MIINALVESEVLVVLFMVFFVWHDLLVQYLPFLDFFVGQKAGSDSCKHYVTHVRLYVIDRANYRVSGHIREDLAPYFGLGYAAGDQDIFRPGHLPWPP